MSTSRNADFLSAVQRVQPPGAAGAHWPAAAEILWNARHDDGLVLFDEIIEQLQECLQGTGETPAGLLNRWTSFRLIEARKVDGKLCPVIPARFMPVAKAEKPPKRTNKQGRSIPTPQVPTRDVSKYGDHLNGIHNSRKLREYPPAQHVAYMLNREMWLKHGNSGFGSPLEFCLADVRRMTGLGADAAGKAAKHMIESGFYRRLDNGNGGKNSHNGATYVPTLPDYSG